MEKQPDDNSYTDRQRPLARKGRGAVVSPKNRFETLEHRPPECSDEGDVPQDVREGGAPRPATAFHKDLSRSIIARNNSPDIPFNASINPYRGCEHGCVYCYARPSHEYLGFSAGLDFETQIMVKTDAPRLLREQLLSPKWRPEMLAISGVTDAYQPAERRYELTRGCLEVLAEFRNPVGIITKNHLVTRDIDLLTQLAVHDAACVLISITSLDNRLTRLLEPRTSTPQRRLDAVRTLADAGIPVGVFASPIIPALNDHEIPALLEQAAAAGAAFVRYTPLRLPGAVAPMFESWLAAHYPDRKTRIMDRIRDMRDGKINESAFGKRMQGTGEFAGQIHALFEAHRRRLNLGDRAPELNTRAFRLPDDGQMQLFQ